MANEGIMHLVVAYGNRPICNTRRSHMGTIATEFEKWPRRCAKCQAAFNRWQAKKVSAADQSKPGSVKS